MQHDEPICPMCEEGHLTPTTFEGDFKHNGDTIHVGGLECHRCGTCGADPVLEDQIRRNHRRIADAKRRPDGLLLGSEIKALRESLGLTQHEAAAVFGGGANAFSKYERGDVIQSVAMDRLMRLIVNHPHLLDALRVMGGEQLEHQEQTAYSKGTVIDMETHKLRAFRADKKMVRKIPWSALERQA